MRQNKTVKKSRLPKHELEICTRLKQAREFLKRSREDVSYSTGIGAQRIANYEYGRAPVKCDVALRICSELIISEKWLATGEGPMQPCLDLENEERVGKIKLGELFSRAYTEILSPIYEDISREPLLDIIKKRLLTGPIDKGRILNLFSYIENLLTTNIRFGDGVLTSKSCPDNIQNRMKELKLLQENDHLYNRLYFAMANAGIEFVMKEKGEIHSIDKNNIPMEARHLLFPRIKRGN